VNGTQPATQAMPNKIVSGRTGCTFSECAPNFQFDFADIVDFRSNLKFSLLQAESFVLLEFYLA